MVGHQAIRVKGAAGFVRRTRRQVEVEDCLEADRADVAVVDDMEWNFGENQASTARHGVPQGITKDSFSTEKIVLPYYLDRDYRLLK